MRTVKLNEYIEKFSEIRPALDEIINYDLLSLERIEVVNDGCDEYIERKVVGYLENHGFIVSFGRKK